MYRRSDLGAESTLDPAFLLEAVQKNCVWGVQLLLKHGASPLAPSKIRWVLRRIHFCSNEVITMHSTNVSIELSNMVYINSPDVIYTKSA